MRYFLRIAVLISLSVTGIACVSDSSLIKEVRTEKRVDLSGFGCIYFGEWTIAFDNNYSPSELEGFAEGSQSYFNEGLSRQGYTAKDKDCTKTGPGRSIKIDLIDGYASVYVNVFDARSGAALFSASGSTSYFAVVGGFKHDVYQALGERVATWLRANNFEQ